MPQPIELTLTSIAPSGEALGYLPDHLPDDKRAIFVADAIPGERVRVEIIESSDDRQRGRLLEILEASPDRVTPPCPYFGPPIPVKMPDGSVLNPDGAPRCAGCVWQHIGYERQLALKREIVIEQLASFDQALGEKLVEDAIALGDPRSLDEDAVLAYGFCTEMDFGLDRRGRLSLPDRNGGLLAVDECLLHHSQLAQLFAAFAVDAETGAALAEELLGVSLAVGATGDDLGDGQGGALVLESRRGEAPQLDLDLPVNVFLRRPAGDPETNTIQADLLVGEWTHSATAGAAALAVYLPLGDRRLFWPHALGNEALPMIAAALLEVQPFEYLLDVWAGFGANSVVLAEQAATIVAVENDPMAAAALQSNLAGVDNVDFLGGPPERVLGEMMQDSYRVHASLLTPPEVADVLPLLPHLVELGVSRLAIITEDSAGLAASITAIQSSGYALTAIQPVDLQPQQSGVTLIVRFDRLSEKTSGYVLPVYQPPPQSRPARPPRSEGSPRRARNRRKPGTKKGSGTKRSK
jgi:23S rRNA (uracil1939-C5)-methyltransferase